MGVWFNIRIVIERIEVAQEEAINHRVYFKINLVKMLGYFLSIPLKEFLIFTLFLKPPHE